MTNQLSKAKKLKEKFKYNYTFKTWLYWRLLRKSGVFNYWLREFLRDLFYDLEMLDLEPNDIRKKYLKRYLKTYRQVELK